MGDNGQAKRNRALEDFLAVGTDMANQYGELKNRREVPESSQDMETAVRLAESVKVLKPGVLRKLPEAVERVSKAMIVREREDEQDLAIPRGVLYKAMETAESKGIDQAKFLVDVVRYHKDKVIPKEAAGVQAFYRRIADDMDNAKDVREFKRAALELMLYDKDMFDWQKQKFIKRYSRKKVKRIKLAFEDPKKNAQREMLENIVGGVGNVLRFGWYAMATPSAARKYNKEINSMADGITSDDNGPAVSLAFVSALLYAAGVAGASLTGCAFLAVPAAVWTASLGYEGVRVVKNAAVRSYQRRLGEQPGSRRQIPEGKKPAQLEAPKGDE
jgi:hypothetical protein